MAAVTQLCASDAQVRQDNPTKNYAGLTYLSTNNGTGVHRRAYLYFNRAAPLGSTIVSATLRLYEYKAATGGSRTLSARRLAAGFKESTITFNNAPGSISGDVYSAAQGNGGGLGRVWEIDVTTLMQLVSDGGDWYGFRIESDNTTDHFLCSSEHALFPPQLVIEWSDAPVQPRILAPSNGRAVSIARPTLRFDFTDVAGDTSMAAYQLQMNLGAEDAVSPDYDSGVIAANIPEHLVTFDVTAAQVWYWRVKVEDGAGLWSAWSDWVSFTRTAKTAVTITNPAVAPNDFVTEATPPFSWTATGQVAYQLFITDPADLTEVLWTSGKVTSTDNSVSLPALATPILAPGGSYTVLVRIWDSVARESTPGDPVYIDASRNFTFELDNTVDPVTSFTATAAAGRPEVTLGWQRATAPDSFTILRRLTGATDWTVLAAALDAADYLVSGTTYAYLVLTVPPRTEYEYAVIAVVNGVSSDDNPTDTATTEPLGVWLSDVDGTHSLSIANPDAVSFDASENSAVHKPLGATNPILITQSVFGREGKVSGFLTEGVGSTLPEAVAEWETLTTPERRGETMLLTLSDTSMRVFIYNVVRGALDDEFVDKIPVRFDYCELI